MMQTALLAQLIDGPHCGRRWPTLAEILLRLNVDLSWPVDGRSGWICRLDIIITIIEPKRAGIVTRCRGRAKSCRVGRDKLQCNNY